MTNLIGRMISRLKGRLSAPSIEFALVAVVWVWVAWPFLTPGKFVYGFDTLSYSGPATKTTFEAWKNLRIPLWSEHVFGGVPFLGRISAQALYFPNLLFSFFQLNTAMDLIIAAHLLLLGFGVLVLIRFGLKLSAPTGSITAITILTSAFVGVKALSLDQLTAIAWLPWILFFLEKMITSERPYKYFSGLSLSVTALVFGGHPQFGYLFLGLSSLFAVSRLLDLRAWKSLIPLFTCAVVTVGVCLLQVYSTYALNASSVMGAKRSLEALSNGAYVLPTNRIFQGVVGNPFGSNPASVSGASEAIVGVSVFVLLLAVVGCFKLWTSQQRITLATLVILGIVTVPLSMGPKWNFFELFYEWVPGFGNARVPGRLLVFTLVCAALLAAYGIHFIVESFQSEKRDKAIAAVVGLISILFFLLVQKSQSFRQLTLFLASAGLVVSLLSARSRRIRQLIFVISFLFLVLVPAYASQRHSLARLSQHSVAFDSYTNKIDEFLTSQDGLTIAMTYDRMDSAKYLVTTLRPNTNILQNIRMIDGYDGGMWVQKRWVEAMKSFTGGKFNNDLTLRSQVVFPISAPAMSRQGVRWALIETEVIGADAQLSGWVGPQMVDGTIQLWQNPTWTGIATVYLQTQLQSSSTDFQRNISDLHQLQILAVEKNGPIVSCSALCNSVPPLSSHYSGDSGGFEINVPQKSVAAIHVSWSKDWRVYVNGIETEIFPVDINQVGVLLPPGLNKVTFQYMPKWVPPLFGLMVMSIILSLLVTALSFLTQKPKATRDYGKKTVAP